MSVPICGLDGCSNNLSSSKYDGYYKREVCLPCFDKIERKATDLGFGEWFEANFKKEDRPVEFWARVGAFI